MNATADRVYRVDEEIITVAGLRAKVTGPVQISRSAVLVPVRYPDGIQTRLSQEDIATHDVRLADVSGNREMHYFVHARDSYTAAYRAGQRGPSNVVVEGVSKL